MALRRKNLPGTKLWPLVSSWCNCCIKSSLLGSNLVDMLCEMWTTKMNVPLPVQLNFLYKEMGDANTSLAASIPGKNHNSGVKGISGPWLSSASEWKKQWSLISCLCGFEFGGPWHQPSGSSKYGSSHCKYHDVDVNGTLITGGQQSSETQWSTGYGIFGWWPMVVVTTATTQWQFQVWLQIANTILVWVAPLSLDDAVKWKEWASEQVMFKHLPTDSGIC